VFDPLFADIQYEWVKAISDERNWKARWIRLRGYWHFLNTLRLQGIVSIGKKILDIWKALSVG